MTDSNPEIEGLLMALATREYWIRKYRTRAESRSLDGNDRSCREYHGMAADERRQADEISRQLTALLGPDDGPPWSGTEYLKLAWRHAEMLRGIAGESESFEDACFARRHPRWAQASERHRAALEKWRGRPELEAMAPGYLPIYDGWTD